MTTKRNTDGSNIELLSTGNHHRVLAGGAELMQVGVGDLYMAGSLSIRDIRFHPAHRLRIAGLMQFWRCFVPPRHPARVAVRGERTAHGLRLCFQPDTRGGVADVKDALEFLPAADSGGWMIEHRCRIVLRKRVQAREIGLVQFPLPNGRPALWWEIDDPNFDGNYGPSVPMKQDWLGVYEPNCGPDTFRKHWRRRVEKFVFQEPSGKVRTIRFHRGLLFSLTKHNRRALPFKRGGFASVLHSDGAGTLYEFVDGQPTFGHLCEWGFDTHFWRLLPGDPDTLVLPKGHVLEARYRIREVPPAAMRRILRGATPIEPTAQEWRQADVPIYEEPVNHFAVSWRDDRAADAWPWIPGVGATWDRRIGRTKPGSLRLDVPLHVMNEGAHWKSVRVGQTNFMNPLVPRARYRLSAYVMTQPSATSSKPSVPSISMTFHQYAGPATFSPEVLPNEVFTGTLRARIQPRRWTKIEAVSAPIRGNIMGVTLGYHLHGGGTAWSDDVVFEKVED